MLDPKPILPLAQGHDVKPNIAVPVQRLLQVRGGQIKKLLFPG